MQSSKKLAIVTTHPIQYNAPWFKLLNERGFVVPKVFYTWSQVELGLKFDPGFNKAVKWDIPLLEGYDFTFVNNTSLNPGSHHKKGIINPTLISQIESWKPDAILIFGWNFISHLECIKYFYKKIPVLFRGDSTLLRKQFFIKKLLRQVYLKWVYHFIDYALYVGKENKKYFKKCGLKNSQLVFAPHAIDNNRFKDADGKYLASAIEWKQQLQIDTNAFVFLYAGKLETIKDPLLLISFAQKFKEQPVHFIIAGNGPLQNRLKDKAANNPQITFIDFQNQQKMPALYRMANCFMLTSKSETWGLCINEAMACGNVVIVRNTCACAPDLVENGTNGFVFDANNMDVLYQQCTQIISNTDLYKKMSFASTQLIQAYSFTQIVTAIEKCLQHRN
jgi:glycosyltransferase involved in cell wall biosynthesis